MLATLLMLAMASQQATLVGWARLEADTLMPGPDSGHFIEAPEGVTLPFEGQPAQGFSAIVPDGEGAFLALADNGFGTRANSPDFLLRIYSLRPDFRTATGGSGEIRIEGFLNLSDPHHHLPWPLTADRTHYDSASGCWPVDRSITIDRLLTGADLDPESLQRMADGSLWIGDEFGPWVIPFNPDGTVAGPPLRLAGLVSEANPELGCCVEKTVLQPASKGFEGLAMAPSGERLYAMLEGARPGHGEVLDIYAVDPVSERFLDASAAEPSYRYRLEPGATAAGDFVLATETIGLVLERDSGQGAEARHKRVYRVDLTLTDAHGLLTKRLVADLLDIADPHDLDGDGDHHFRFPHHTPEGLVVLDRNTIGVINDNNYPFGRARGDGPDPTEFILLSVDDLW